MAMEEQRGAEMSRLKANTSEKPEARGSQCLLQGLPNEIAVCCLARIPLSSCCDARRVCRSWHQFFHASKGFWDVRRELAVSEELLLLWGAAPYKGNIWHGFFPSTKKWFIVPKRPEIYDQWDERSSAFAAFDKKLFRIGGRLRRSLPQDHVLTRQVIYFDLQSFEWKEAAPLNIARAHSVAGVIHNRLYVCGGVHVQCKSTNTAEVYDPVTQRWEVIAEIPAELAIPMARGHLNAVTINGKFYVADQLMTNDTGVNRKGKMGIQYDPERDKWTKMAEGLNSGWSQRPVVHNGKLHCKRSVKMMDGSQQQSIWRFDESENTWNLMHSPMFPPDKVTWSKVLGNKDHDQLVSLGGDLYLVSKRADGDAQGKYEMIFEIRDVTNNLIASRSLGPPTAEELRDYNLNHWVKKLHWEVVTL